MENGSLRSYLDKNFNSITWKQKLSIMFSVAYGLHLIHNFNLTHKDLHLGNVLQSLINNKNNFIGTTFIGDFGFCKPADEISSKNIYGVMPYMAPEILRRKGYTQKSDVYSLGVIINEVISIIPPFNKEPHDYHLALDICRGKRPEIREESPKYLKELIQKCWDENPENRPTSEEVMKKLEDYVYIKDNDGYLTEKYTEQVEKLEELSHEFAQLSTITESTTKTRSFETRSFGTHAQAFYTSRLLNFTNLPEPVNCPNQQEFISSRNTGK